jgi:hypothetical protein
VIAPGLNTSRRVLLVAVVANSALIVAGIFVVPATLQSLDGLGILAADIGLQLAIVIAGCWGPISLGRLGDAAGWCVAVGGVFALVYVGSLLVDFAGHPVALSPYVFFVAAAVAGALPVALATRRPTRAMLASAWSLVLGTLFWSTGLLVTAYSFWGTRGAHGFWLRDGALAEFRHSGAKNLSVFLLQDLQGAIFFHPFLSAIVGLAGGLVVAAVALPAATLRDHLVPR